MRLLFSRSVNKELYLLSICHTSPELFTHHFFKENSKCSQICCPQNGFCRNHLITAYQIKARAAVRLLRRSWVLPQLPALSHTMTNLNCECWLCRRAGHPSSGTNHVSLEGRGAVRPMTPVGFEGETVGSDSCACPWEGRGCAQVKLCLQDVERRGWWPGCRERR